MKFSDKALRQIGRKLLEHTDSDTHQDDRSTPGKPGFQARHPRLPGGIGARRAAVLRFRKRLC